MHRRTMLAALLSCAALAGLAFGQGRMKSKPNAQSPAQQTEVTINGAKIMIEYNAPSVRGRKIFGEHEPYGKVWRTGADAATTLTTSADLTIGSLKVPKGVYSLYTVPGANSWELIVNKQTGQWGTEYDKGQDLGRVPLKVSKTPSLVEQMQIELKAAGKNQGMLAIRWENTEASTNFTVGK